MKRIAAWKAKEKRVPIIAAAAVASAVCALHVLTTEQGGVTSVILGLLAGLFVWAIVRSTRVPGLERSVAANLSERRAAMIAEEFPQIEALSVKAGRGKVHGLSLLAAIPEQSDTAYGDLIEGRHDNIPFAINEIREWTEKWTGKNVPDTEKH